MEERGQDDATTKKTEIQKTNEKFLELYKIGKAKTGLTDAQCAAIIGVCPKTLYNQMKTPIEKISLLQFLRLGVDFKWTDEDYLAIIRPDVRK